MAKVKAPPIYTLQRIKDMTPEEAAEYWAAISMLPPNQGRAFLRRLGAAKQGALQTRINAPPEAAKNMDIPFLAPEGLDLGAARIDQKTGRPVGTGLAPGTHMFKGLDPENAAKYSAEVAAGAEGLAALYSGKPYQPTTHAPRYLYGTQFEPQNYDVDTMIALQEKLEKAGLLEPGSYVRGHWGGTSAAAYSAALADANVADKDVDEIIQGRIDNPQVKKREPLVTTLTNPADIMQATKTAARSLYGRNIELPQSVQDQLVAGLQETERQAYAQQYAIEDPEGPGGTITAPPTPDAYAEQQLKTLYPGRETDDEFSDAMNTILNMMGPKQ